MKLAGAKCDGQIHQGGGQLVSQERAGNEKRLVSQSKIAEIIDQDFKTLRV